MRKADYTALAAIIKETREHYSQNEIGGHHCEPVEACEHIAREFAKTASVNRAEFLKACGIEP